MFCVCVWMWMCTWVKMPRGQKKDLSTSKMEFKAVLSHLTCCLDLNSGSLQEQSTLNHEVHFSRPSFLFMYYSCSLKLVQSSVLITACCAGCLWWQRLVHFHSVVCLKKGCFRLLKWKCQTVPWKQFQLIFFLLICENICKNLLYTTIS